MAFFARHLSSVAVRAAPRLLSPVVARPVGVAFAVAAKPFAVRTFATTKLVATPVEKKLAAFLKRERGLEEDFESDVVKQYLKKSPFKVHDDPDSMEVQLKRTLGNEEIIVQFEYQKDSQEPNFGFDENEEGENQEENERGEQGEAEGQSVPHLPFMVQISKQAGGVDKGTATFECVADNGQVIITNVIFSKDSKTALAHDVESDWKRASTYGGPDFLSLESELQEMFFEYLEERGINSDLAEFLPEYINIKENKSYLRWLEGLSKFME